MATKHARGWNGNDMTLCGLAEEAADDPATGETEPVEYVDPGRFVTCYACKRVIEHCQTWFTRNYRLKIVE